MEVTIGAIAQTNYDVVIAGSGPAGLAAGIYTGRAKVKTAILEKEIRGGQLMNVEWVENYPGFGDGVSGPELASKMISQVAKYGVDFKLAEVKRIQLREQYKLIESEKGEYIAKAVIIAGGARSAKLGVPGENEFEVWGRGVIYCAVCHGGQFANRVVAVAGGGDSGITEALYLARLASKVVVIEQMPQLNASKILQERALNNEKIEIRCGTKIEAIIGEDKVKALKLQNTSRNEKTILEVDGVLVRIGLEPNTSYLKGLIDLSTEGFVIVNEKMETSVPGIFAAGDLRESSMRQVASAVGDGVTAAISACRYIG